MRASKTRYFQKVSYKIEGSITLLPVSVKKTVMTENRNEVSV